MSTAVLALKWRPRVFSEVIGQEHVLKPLIHSLDRNRLHHAYLFSGTRGTGKTTLARILARCLNCEKAVSSNPCGECSPCKSILAGAFPGLIEVDAASRTQVSDTRELLETVSYSPMDGRYKVYLIDEIHMLSNHSFNALLKTLEEPPEHVCFLFATTEPERLPTTILSRCLQFNLRTLGEEALKEHLQKVLEADGIPAEPGALMLIAEAARGSVRDSLTITEQAISHGNGQLKTAEVAAMLGTLDREATARILHCICESNGRELMAELNRVASLGADPGTVLDRLLRMLYEIALLQAVPEDEADPLIQKLATQIDREEIQLYYQIALTSSRDLQQASDPWTGLRMAALRLLAFAPNAPNAPAADKKPRAEEPKPAADASPNAESKPPASEKSTGSRAEATPSAAGSKEKNPLEEKFANQPEVKDILSRGGEILSNTLVEKPGSKTS